MDREIKKSGYKVEVAFIKKNMKLNNLEANACANNMKKPSAKMVL